MLDSTSGSNSLKASKESRLHWDCIGVAKVLESWKISCTLSSSIALSRKANSQLSEVDNTWVKQYRSTASLQTRWTYYIASATNVAKKWKNMTLLSSIEGSASWIHCHEMSSSWSGIHLSYTCRVFFSANSIKVPHSVQYQNMYRLSPLLVPVLKFIW